MRFSVCTGAGVLVLAAFLSVAAQQTGLDSQIVNDLFRGFGGDVTALKRGFDASTKRLAESPDDPEVLAWHGAAILSWSRQGALDADFGARVKMFQQATGEMDRAVMLAPDNARVRQARGVLLHIETPGMPRFANHPGLVERAREDYQRLFDLHKDSLQKLSEHRLGELLQGLGDLNSRQGKVEDAERYYRMIQTSLPGTEYAKRANVWMSSKQPLVTSLTTCIGCHESR
jgi:tetratricopeptide (TPR) repeat protein